MTELATGSDEPVDPARFRAVLGRFATGVAIMSATLDGEPHGMTANALSSVSLSPPLVLVCVDRGAEMARVIERSPGFALTFLGEGQADVSSWFADGDRPGGREQFSPFATFQAVTGSPIIDDAHGWVDCRTWAVYDGGDHVIVVGEVVSLGEPVAGEAVGADAPLLYHRGGYARLTHLTDLADPG